MGDVMKESSFSLAEAYFAAGDFRFVENMIICQKLSKSQDH